VLGLGQALFRHTGPHLLHLVDQVDGGRTRNHQATCGIAAGAGLLAMLERIKARHAKLYSKTAAVNVNGPDIVDERFFDVRQIDKLDLD